MKKRTQNPFKKIWDFFEPLQLPEQKDNSFYFGPSLEPYTSERIRNVQADPRSYPEDYVQSDYETDRINKNRLEQAKLSQTQAGLAQSAAALNLTLKSQHRLLIATLVTALVALTVGLISLLNKPPVVNIEPPVVNVQPPDIHTNATPQ